MEHNISSRKQQKQKVRDKYGSTECELLEYIPEKILSDININSQRRVAVYVRVSTDNLEQVSSYELQKNYYTEYVNDHENWTLVDIYADEGISGTSLMHREAFQRMIEDCKNGKIDLVITKSISRFARNIVDCVHTLDMLKGLKNPVGVFFETENMYSLDKLNDMMICFAATIAQEESHIKSNSMNASVDMRFSRGICLTPVLLGYDHDDEGNLVINEIEANTVKLIFFMYLYGYSCPKIAEMLTELGRVTKKGNNVWNSNSVLEILRNERYCGEILTSKTFTPNYKDHKSKKNRGERKQYRWKGKHQPIITRDDYIAVQHLIDNAKYKNKGFLPELKIITEGLLKGFIAVNPRWAGFKAAEYYELAKSVCERQEETEDLTIQVNGGDFDFRGFEVARSQFFNIASKISVTFSSEKMSYSINCLKKLDNCEYIEMFIQPLSKLLAVRATNANSKNAVKWAKRTENGQLLPRTFGGAAYIKTFYEMFQWSPEYKYRLLGTRYQKGEDAILIFDISEAEMYVGRELISKENISEITTLSSAGKSVIAYPQKWASNFGNEYYLQEQTADTANAYELSGEKHEIVSFDEMHHVNVKSRDEIESGIRSMIAAMASEEKTDE